MCALYYARYCVIWVSAWMSTIKSWKSSRIHKARGHGNQERQSEPLRHRDRVPESRISETLCATQAVPAPCNMSRKSPTCSSTRYGASVHSSGSPFIVRRGRLYTQQHLGDCFGTVVPRNDKEEVKAHRRQAWLLAILRKARYGR